MMALLIVIMCLLLAEIGACIVFVTIARRIQATARKIIADCEQLLARLERN